MIHKRASGTAATAQYLSFLNKLKRIAKTGFSRLKKYNKTKSQLK